MFFALATNTLSVLGGWKEVKPDSEFVEAVRPYINENYLKMLPEYKEKNTLLAIESAKIQIVNGFNIQIKAKLGFDEVDFSLYVSPQKSIKLTNFGITPANIEERPVMGGWSIRTSDFDHEIINEAVAAYKKQNGLTAEMTKIFLVRTQIVAGLNIHIVYQDADGTTHSINMYRNLSGEYKLNSADSF
jgi:hypothetical protein